MQNMYNCVQCCKVKEGNLFQHFLFNFQEHAFESSQKYKEGKFIIELAHMIKDNGWAWLGWQTFDRFLLTTAECDVFDLPYDDEGKVDLGPGKLCHCCRLGLLSLCVFG